MTRDILSASDFDAKENGKVFFDVFLVRKLEVLIFLALLSKINSDIFHIGYIISDFLFI